MPTMTTSAELYSGDTDLGTFINEASAQAALDALEAHFSLSDAEIDALFSALDAEPTLITAAKVRWGSVQDGVELTGSGLGQIENLDQLISDLENGVLSGAFDLMTLYSGGDTLATVSFDDDKYEISAAGQTLTLNGALPDTMQEMFDFVVVLVDLSLITETGDPAIPAIVTFMNDYGLTSLEYDDGTDTIFSFSQASDSITIEIAGATLVVEGTFPISSFGALISFVDTYADTDITDLDQVAGLGVTSIILTDKDGRVHLEVDGNIGETDPLYLDSVTVNGTDADDRNVYGDLYSTEEAGAVNYNLAGGDDSIEFEFWADLFGMSFAPTSVDLGADGGTIVLENYHGGDYFVDFGAGTLISNIPGVGTDAGKTSSVSINFTTQTRIELGYNSDWNGQSGFAELIGGAADDRVVIASSNNDIMFEGGAGTDVVELHRTDFSFSSTEGITRSDFEAGMSFQFNGDFLDFNFEDNSFEAINMQLLDVENFRFKTTGDGTETVAINDVLATVGVQAGTSGADRLLGSESGQFIAGLGGDDAIYADGFKGRYDDGVAGQVYRLYQATLDRAPDVGGFNGWTSVLSHGDQTLEQVATGFVDSVEFLNVYSNLSNEQFVELLYQNVLDRSADAGGLANWVNQLENGQTRSFVVVGFSESTEFQNNTTAAAAAYATGVDPASWSDEVFRIYQATFDRAPDVGGFQNWTNQLASLKTLNEAITSFTEGPEFQNTYGQLDDTQFVELLYQNVLNRVADEGGLANWLDGMDNGLSRADVVKGFVNAPEFITNTTPDLIDWMRENTQDHRVYGGDGTNVLAGGIGSDTFEFHTDDDADNTVLDLEAWDLIFIQGTNNVAEIQANLSQVGDDVVFEDVDLKITFEDVDIAIMTNDMFIFDAPIAIA